MRTLMVVTSSLCLLLLSACQEDPVSCFTVDIESTYHLNHTFQFSDCSEEADTYTWDFGDGNTSNDPSPSHAYQDFGKYRVELITENNKGQHISTKYVNVGMPRLIAAEMTNFQSYYGEPDSISCFDIRIHADSILGRKQGIASAWCGDANFNIFTVLSNAGERQGHFDNPNIPLQVWANYVVLDSPFGKPVKDTSIYMGEVPLDLLNQLEYTTPLNSACCDLELNMVFELDPEYTGR